MRPVLRHAKRHFGRPIVGNEPVADFVKLVLKVIKFANGGG